MNKQLVNKRRNNTIYTDGQYAYKIFNTDYAKTDVFMEALITSNIETLGLNVPSIESVSMIDDKWAIKFPNISGKSLFDLIAEDTSNTEKYIEQLVAVQINIHSNKCPVLPIQKQKLEGYINDSPIDESLKIDLTDMLSSSPKHKKLCHGNFTPHNVIISDGVPYITDWNHATQGNASADIARTYLWMKVNMPDFAEMYLDKFCECTNTSSRYVHNWIPIVAAARLAKSIPEEQDFLKSLISVIEF